MVVDLTSRPYFVGNLPVPEFQAQKGQTNILTLTEGIVGPIVPQFPLNITTILDLPKVCNLGVSPSLVSRYCEGCRFWSISGP